MFVFGVSGRSAQLKSKCKFCQQCLGRQRFRSEFHSPSICYNVLGLYCAYTLKKSVWDLYRFFRSYFSSLSYSLLVWIFSTQVFSGINPGICVSDSGFSSVLSAFGILVLVSPGPCSSGVRLRLVQLYIQNQLLLPHICSTYSYFYLLCNIVIWNYSFLQPV